MFTTHSKPPQGWARFLLLQFPVKSTRRCPGCVRLRLSGHNSRMEFNVRDAMEAPAGGCQLPAATIPGGVYLEASRQALPIRLLATWTPPFTPSRDVCVRQALFWWVQPDLVTPQRPESTPHHLSLCLSLLLFALRRAQFRFPLPRLLGLSGFLHLCLCHCPHRPRFSVFIPLATRQSANPNVAPPWVNTEHHLPREGFYPGPDGTPEIPEVDRISLGA